MYRALIVRPVIQLALICCLGLSAAACGQKGDLYMPEQGEADQANRSSQQ